MGDFSAVDRDSRQPVPGLTGENLGEVLTGVSREVFDRSVFLRQTGLAVTQSQELERRIAALVSSGEEGVSWSEADQCLRNWKRRRRYHKTGLLPQLEGEEQTLLDTQTRTAYLRRTLEEVKGRADALQEQKENWDSRLEEEERQFRLVGQQRMAEATASLEAARDRVQALEEAGAGREEDRDMEKEQEEIRHEMKVRKRRMTGFVVLAVLVTLVCGVLFLIPRLLAEGIPLSIPMLSWPVCAGVAGGIWVLVILFSIVKSVSDRRGRRTLSMLTGEIIHRDHQAREWKEAVVQENQAQKYFDAVSRQGEVSPYHPPEAEACRESLNIARQEQANLQGQLDTLGDPVIVDAKLDSIREQKAMLQTDYEALDMALEAMEEANARLHARFSPELSHRAGEYFARLTEGRYTRVDLTRDMEITVQEEGELALQPLAYLSKGTTDLLYLALRLAVADLVLPEPDEVPLILDDALLAMDDTRMELASETLLELASRRQVILFTCQRREFRLLTGRKGVAIQKLTGA